MRLEVRKFLYDMRRAADALATFTDGRTFDDYQSDAMLRSAVERQFEIIGEALGRLAQVDVETSERISDHRRIIAFRNVLIHGYADVDDRLVWGVLERDLSTLRAEVEALLAANEIAN
ncbi:MAG: HepT-like ribonuclease domain-containing protein [Nitrolancea sp.]